jgi:hypothetical protein
MYRASGALIVSDGVGALTTAGTLAARLVASGSAKNATQRIGLTGTLASAYLNGNNILPLFRGGQNGEGGFLYNGRFSLETLSAGNRGFFGLTDVITAPTNIDPLASATPGKIGLAFNANTGNWRLVHNVTGTAPTAIDLGANFPINTTDLMELTLFVRPHDGTSAGSYGYRIRRYTTNSATHAFETNGTLSANLPAQATLLHLTNWMAAAASVSFNFHQIGVESDW